MARLNVEFRDINSALLELGPSLVEYFCIVSCSSADRRPQEVDLAPASLSRFDGEFLVTMGARWLRVRRPSTVFFVDFWCSVTSARLACDRLPSGPLGCGILRILAYK
ncbi:hypothetical protein Dimus_000048 [Dionaea muscipula]